MSIIQNLDKNPILHRSGKTLSSQYVNSSGILPDIYEESKIIAPGLLKDDKKKKRKSKKLRRVRM